MNFKKFLQILHVSIAVLLITSCGYKAKESKKIITLSGSGSSFALPLSQEFFRKYSKISDTTIDFSSTDSYQGIEAVINGTVDFALSEVYIEQKNSNILHIPISVAGINFAYNIPDEGFSLMDDPIYMDADIIAKILTGKITKWNDSQIVQLNKKYAENKQRVFPNLNITPIYRSTPSGDTYILTSFLKKASAFWPYGTTNQITVPSGLTATSTLDAMKVLLNTPGGFGYTTMIFAVQNNIPLVRVKNNANVFVRGCNFRSLEAMKVAETNIDNKVDLTYPTQNNAQESAVAATFIYLLVQKEQNYNNKSKEQAQALVDMLAWFLSPDAQKNMESILFSNLTPKFRKAAQDTISQITYNGEVLTPNKISPKKEN
ncbi:MAG: substrate-binding domain-containing protein [Brevinemataceae bacterium]